MKIIIGLGNPGKEYDKTRHNAGFVFLDTLLNHSGFADGNQSEFSLNKKFEAEIVEIKKEGEKIVLVKPQTFMNSSGKAVAAVLKYYKAGLEDLIVINDDIDLPIGTLRIRQGGGSAGQRGLQNVIDSLGSEDFVRFRIGVGIDGEDESRVSRMETVDFVLSKFSDRETPILKETINQGVEYLLGHLGKKDGIPAHSIQVKSL